VAITNQIRGFVKTVTIRFAAHCADDPDFLVQVIGEIRGSILLNCL
jgi:hypothetical protein